MTHAIKEALWIRLFLTIHQFPIPRPFPILCDNQSALSLIQSEAISSRSKHIDVRYHFIRDHVSDGSFSPTWIPTSDTCGLWAIALHGITSPVFFFFFSVHSPTFTIPLWMCWLLFFIMSIIVSPSQNM